MERPTPRVALGVALRRLATSAIDVSDGLLGDLRHVLTRSGVGATIDADAVPVGAVLAAQPIGLRRECALAGGDDYELLFTAPAAREAEVRAAAGSADCAVTRIGRIDAAQGLRVVDRDGQPVAAALAGFDHFKVASA